MMFNPQGIHTSLDDVISALNIVFPETHLTVTGITHDNRNVEPGFIFVALAGFNKHGIEFAPEAVDAGAVAVLTDSDGAHQMSGHDVPVIVSANPRADMAHAAQIIYGNSQSRLMSVGITGTNGKTTTAHMVNSLLEQNHMKPLMIGTVGIRFDGESIPSSRTTPESSELHKLLCATEQQGSKSLVMEVSSHALTLSRVGGVVFDVAVFTGLTQDHLDFHGNMENYFEAKASLFTSSMSKHAVVCIDDEWGQKLIDRSEIPTLTYSVTRSADWTARDIKVDESGRTTFIAKGPVAEFEINLALPGIFNVANALAAIAVSDALNLVDAKIAESLADVTVAGRLERINKGQRFVALVDYAHTPDAVSRVVEVARTYATGKVITVLGCGGDRDSTKRPLMGSSASPSDVIVVTDDNPRSEDPSTIRTAIKSGVLYPSKVVEIGDRESAIVYAVSIAQAGDWILVLGKGHETGQEVNGVITPFDDREVLGRILEGSL
jgi:UDP-N-acetylmuramoyl-L-alanyl-D-glutamate--2,6-diaminopimelate ligase